MECAAPPVIIPMWLTGFETLMPEGRNFPYKYIPRPGARLSVNFGEPMAQDEISSALSTNNNNDEARVRAEVTAIVQRAVESLGRSVSGASLEEHKL